MSEEITQAPEEADNAQPASEAPEPDAPSREGAEAPTRGALGGETSPLHHPAGMPEEDFAGQHAMPSSDAAHMGPDSETAEEPPVAAAEHARVAAERDDYLDQLRRARADYDNLNKRRQREVADARDRGAAALVASLLEVLDNFGFALQAAAASDDEALAKGVTLVHEQLLRVLGGAGLEAVPGTGSAFDPAHHEAVLHEDDGQERDEPEVAEVLRTGYRFKNQLLRPASVKVVG